MIEGYVRNVLLWHKAHIIIALKFNKLFTVLWDSSECCQLSDVDSGVSNIFTVTSGVIPITSRNIFLIFNF